MNMEEFKTQQAPCYIQMPDDGAKFRCSECDGMFPHTDIYLIRTPNGSRSVLCFCCIDPGWRGYAKNCGKLTLD